MSPIVFSRQIRCSVQQADDLLGELSLYAESAGLGTVLPDADLRMAWVFLGDARRQLQRRYGRGCSSLRLVRLGN